MEQASVVFVVAFALQSVALLIVWASASKSHKRLDVVENYLEMFTMATAQHVKRIDEKIKENSNA
jgi:hypothetical protein